MPRVLRGPMELLDPKVSLDHVVKRKREMMRATAEMRPIEGVIYRR
jgi:hypothetical protein